MEKSVEKSKISVLFQKENRGKLIAAAIGLVVLMILFNLLIVYVWKRGTKNLSKKNNNKKNKKDESVKGRSRGFDPRNVSKAYTYGTLPHTDTSVPKHSHLRPEKNTLDLRVFDTTLSNAERRNAYYNVSSSSSVNNQGDSAANTFPFSIPENFGSNQYSSFQVGGGSFAIGDAAAASDPSSTIPSSWDWREKIDPSLWPQIKDQMCNFCWSYAPTTSLAYRFAIHAKKALNFSPLLVVTKAPAVNSGDPCGNENSLANAWGVIAGGEGIPEADCDPYARNQDDSSDNKCCNPSPKLDASSKPACISTKYTATNIRSVGDEGASRSDNIKDLQLEIMRHGPAPVCLAATQEFVNLNSAVILDVPSSSQALGGHAVCIVGWGEDTNGRVYWIIHNSYGTKWGNYGYGNIYADVMDIADVSKGYGSVVADPSF